jgi:hypothetical protein
MQNKTLTQSKTLANRSELSALADKQRAIALHRKYEENSEKMIVPWTSIQLQYSPPPQMLPENFHKQYAPSSLRAVAPLLI